MFLHVRSSFLMARALPLAFNALAAQAPLDTLETVKRSNRNYNHELLRAAQAGCNPVRR